MEKVYADLMYFGYEYDKGSKENQTDFMREAKERFEHIEFREAYDQIKGYRQEVYIDEANKQNFKVWQLAFGWWELSMNWQLIMLSTYRDPVAKETFEKCFRLAKQEYPQQFKIKNEN